VFQSELWGEVGKEPFKRKHLAELMRTLDVLGPLDCTGNNHGGEGSCMIDMIDIYRKLRDNYSQGDFIQVQLVVPLMNRFIVHFTHEDELGAEALHDRDLQRAGHRSGHRSR
jgi:hypothetical protein